MTLILAIAFMGPDLFIPNSAAHPYELYLTITVVKCWDNSGSIKVLCGTKLKTLRATDPANHDDYHKHSSSDTHITLKGPEDTFTDSCYIGCSSS